MAHPYKPSTEIKLSCSCGGWVVFSDYKDPMLNEWILCHMGHKSLDAEMEREVLKPFVIDPKKNRKLKPSKNVSRV
jgi:hypothetical protein